MSCSVAITHKSFLKDFAVAGKEAMMAQLEMVKTKYEEALEARKKAEQDIEAFKPVSSLAVSNSHETNPRSFIMGLQQCNMKNDSQL